MSESSAVEEAEKSMTLFASSFTSLLSDPSFNLSEVGLRAFLVNKSSLRRAFLGTSFKDMSHLFGLMGSGSDGQSVISEKDWWRLMIAMSLDNLQETLFPIIESLSSSSQLLLWVSLMDNKWLVTEKEQRNLDRLLSMAGKITISPILSLGELDMFGRVWFVCSYWDSPHKHVVKKMLNQAFYLHGLSIGIKNERRTRSKGVEHGKPKLLVILEAWGAGHAMYRCYGKAFETLKEKFHVTAMAPKNRSDAESTKMFDELIFFNEKGDLKETIDRVENINPKIIIYSSIGMQPQAIFLSQYRLAPIQMMMMGHPASSFSEKIDYAVIEEDILNNPECFSETILLLKGGALAMIKPDRRKIAKVGRESGSVPDLQSSCKVVCNSMYQKLTPAFINACIEIQKRSKVHVEFIFLTGTDGLSSRAIKPHLESRLDRVRVFRKIPYEFYSKLISECQLQLTPFPFGNTNSFVDAMFLGVPTVCMDGDEVMSHNDVAYSRRVGLPDFLQARDFDGYVAAALKVIEDPALQKSLRDHILSLDLDEILFSEKKESESEFSDLVFWTYTNHDNIREMDKKVWRTSDRKEVAKKQP